MNFLTLGPVFFLFSLLFSVIENPLGVHLFLCSLDAVGVLVAFHSIALSFRMGGTANKTLCHRDDYSI